MGYHSQGYYNTKCFKGNTDKTGFAWWYDQSFEDPNNPSHFAGPIPLELMRNVFGWTAHESISLVAKFVIDGKEYEVPVPADQYKALGRGDWIEHGIPDSEEEGASKILSVVSGDYGTQQLKEIFITNVADLLDGADNIVLESFGELKWGRRAFASVSLPENVVNNDSNLAFRPIMTIVTSFDRTLATKYVRTYGIPVCDNTVNYELARAGEKDGHFVLRHSKNSAARLPEAKKVLGLLTEQADEMNKWLSELVKVEVPEAHFIKWLNKMVPVPEIKKSIVTVKSIQGEDTQIEKVSTNAQTIALKKRDKLVEMWDRDERVAPWKNTRLGIFQLWNTFLQYETGVKATASLGGGKDATDLQKQNAKIRARIEKNMDLITNPDGSGSFMKEDSKALDAIISIQAEEKELVAAVPAGAPTSDPAKRVPRCKPATNN
jgi:phage/plasmid-like protein (TIGR03299 family)